MTTATIPRTDEQGKLAADDIQKRGYAKPEFLVSTEWVASHLTDPAVRIVESNEDPLLYSSGHIPGAVEIDWTKDLNNPLRRDYLDQDAFAANSHRKAAAADG